MNEYLKLFDSYLDTNQNFDINLLLTNDTIHLNSEQSIKSVFHKWLFI